ncbi:MAG: hypothetical protein AAB958_00770 [Patescibacteria group bacterium]
MTDEITKIKIWNEDNDSEDDSPSSEISWQIEDGPTNPINSQWLWALAIVSFAVIVFSIMLKNYLLIVIVFLSAFIIYISKNKKPESHNFRLTNEGLYIDGKFYSYENFESYWIFGDHQELEKELALRYKRRVMPLLIAPFHSNDESSIEEIISNHLPQNEEEESFLDLLRKKLF